MKRIKATSKVSNMYSETEKEQVIQELKQVLIDAEQSGFTKLSVADIRKEARAELNLD
jgi:protein-arginine kinase